MRPLFNLESVYEDAVWAMQYADYMGVPPLPAAVCMLQADVINSYRHALEHYLSVPLSAEFLQNSSLGSPYEKWAIFTNKDFHNLTFSIHNLLRYTTRLLHEVDAGASRSMRDPDPAKGAAVSDQECMKIGVRRIAAASPIREIRELGKSVGLLVQPDEHVSIRFLRCDPPEVKVGIRHNDNSVTYFVIGEEQGNRTETVISREEYVAHTAVIRDERICIRDRQALAEIHDRGRYEIGALELQHGQFIAACQKHAQHTNIFGPHERLTQNYWV